MNSYRRPVQAAAENNTPDALTSTSASAPLSYRRLGRVYRRFVRALSPVGTCPIAGWDMPISLQTAIHGSIRPPIRAWLHGCPQHPVQAPVTEAASKHLADAVTAALTPADHDRYGLHVGVGAGRVWATVTPPAGADLIHLGRFLAEVLELRGLGSWRPFADFGAGAVVLLRRVNGGAPDS